jgi:hypothetical protein
LGGEKIVSLNVVRTKRIKEGAMTENEIAKIVVNIAYNIHVKLGPSLLESVYEEILYY